MKQLTDAVNEVGMIRGARGKVLTSPNTQALPVTVCKSCDQSRVCEIFFTFSGSKLWKLFSAACRLGSNNSKYPKKVKV